MRVVASLKEGTIFPGRSKNRVPGENRRTSGHVHVDSLALIKFSRIRLVNIKKINQNMIINIMTVCMVCCVSVAV